MISKEVIENFLEGNNPLKYVVAIEGGYREPTVDLVIHDPVRGKYIKTERYRPFIWFKEDVKKLLFGGDRHKMKAAADKKDIRTKKLTTADSSGFTPERLDHGFKYLATTTNSYNELVHFFRGAGVDIFDAKYKGLFLMFTPVEQYMIQSGVRLFKGMEDYNDLHRMQFDLETEGLLAHKHGIFAIGIKDNRGFEKVIKIAGATAQERRNSERLAIIELFEIISEKKPDIIAGYNSESFDWDFIVKRCERLNLNLNQIAYGYNGETTMSRKEGTLKLGNERESYTQTYLWGTNIIDVAHSVRRQQAIETDIKSWTLKYITKYSDVAKKNRVYVKGDKIYTLWSDAKNQFAFNDKDGDWYKISERMPLKIGYEIVTGAYIIERYLLDDLWETEEVDYIFNQAAFLISKLLPTTYSRSITMGTASQWKLLMAAWSYETNLAIPITTPKRDFTGGLSRLLAVGYSKNVVKFDFAALYPKTQLTHDIFPNLDISDVMKGMLTYIVDTRDKYKFLGEEHKEIVEKLKQEIKDNKTTYSKEKIAELEEEIKKNKAAANICKKKQMPLKILANSWFGAYGAPYIFNWGDTDCAEETTCRGRQYFRLMVKYFTDKFGFQALVGDTDGVNFKVPDETANYKYTAKGTHWKTTKFANVELSGVDAVLAEFNENFMIGRMGLDIDEVCNATINFSRKNYATDIKGKIKFVGNSIKSKKMPVYIEDFLDVAIRLLLDGKGKEFINHYYEYVNKIYNYNIPLVKIASKWKIKSTVADYKIRMTKKNKAGKPMNRQAHMELVMANNLEVNYGDTIFYVNTGSKKNDGDAKMEKHEDGTSELNLNCKLIDSMKVELDLEVIKEIETMRKMIKENGPNEELEERIKEAEESLVTDEYNVAKYLESFNKKVKPLLVCFHPDIRNKILIGIKRDRKTKLDSLQERSVFATEQCELVSGMPNKPTDQDDYDEHVLKMEDKEIKFWISVNKLPNNIEEDVWKEVVVDYHARMVIAREQGIIADTNLLDNFIRRLESTQLEDIVFKTKLIPENIVRLASVDADGNFVSRKWGVIIGNLDDLLKYEDEAKERAIWYQLSNAPVKKRFDLWMEHLLKNPLPVREIVPVKSVDPTTIVIPEILPEEKIEKDLDDDDDEEEEEDEHLANEEEEAAYLAQMQKEIDELLREPEFTYLAPYKEEEKDEWNF